MATCPDDRLTLGDLEFTSIRSRGHLLPIFMGEAYLHWWLGLLRNVVRDTSIFRGNYVPVYYRNVKVGHFRHTGKLTLISNLKRVNSGKLIREGNARHTVYKFRA